MSANGQKIGMSGKGQSAVEIGAAGSVPDTDAGGIVLTQLQSVFQHKRGMAPKAEEVFAVTRAGGGCGGVIALGEDQELLSSLTPPKTGTVLYMFGQPGITIDFSKP